MAATLEAKYVFGTEGLEWRAKVVKFAVIQGNEREGAAQEHELASFEAVMLPHMDAAHNLARWLLRNEQDAQDVVQWVPWFQWAGMAADDRAQYILYPAKKEPHSRSYNDF
jgi:hypothetical protein